MEQDGHAGPAPRADKTTWLQRATFDLTGLPPRQKEVEAFLADKSKECYAKVVDRLLASRQYGERWGRHWLDLVRYADTAGDSADYPVPERLGPAKDEMVRWNLSRRVLCGQLAAKSEASAVVSGGSKMQILRFAQKDMFHLLR